MESHNKENGRGKEELTMRNGYEGGVRNPFGRSSVIMRSPEADGSEKSVKNVDSIRDYMSTPVNAQKTDNSEEEKRHLSQLKKSEERAFIELGNKLNTANIIASGLKNTTKSIRDNLTSACALYKQLKEYREAIEINPVVLRGESRQVHSKATQVDPISPPQDRKRKVAKTPAAVKALQTLGEINVLEETSAPDTPAAVNEWERVSHRKSKRRKNEKNNKRREMRDQGEAITIKAKSTESYADVIKEMKRKINPTDIGVEIQGIRRTRAGELLVKLKKGEGQAEKLKSAIGNKLGEDVLIKAVTKNTIIDIRDMDESTDETDIVNALIEVTKVEQPTTFKILNFRTSFGGTKQALVQLPEHLAAPLLQARKVRVGWVMCRLRRKIRVTQCFRCLEQGHIASQCKGTDRGSLCRKCCNPGHKAKDCRAEAKCILCHESGSINVRHFIGSAECVTNRRNKAAR